ncbi:MAG: redoxin domain-containing protein [Acidobacteria bacterium]|nr:redoxin domain-containing protein [Acidobacteriota bacterium]
MPPSKLPAPPTLAALAVFAALVLSHAAATPARAAASGDDAEYTGKFDGELVANTEDLDEVVFHPLRDLSKVKFEKPPAEGATVTAGRLNHPPTDKSSILAVLVESEDELPVLYADVNLDGTLAESERFELARGGEDGDNPYVWQTTLKLATPGQPFAVFPVYVEYLKDVRWDDMQEGERMVEQSKKAFARGAVDIAGKKTLVQYGYDPRAKKISAVNGVIGIDGDGDGEIDMSRFSPEAAETQDEAVVFRVGDRYVSTKRVDAAQNLIVLRPHPASDYKRVELRVGSELPDFQFTDFRGKKRQLSEFKGKYVLIDFWGLWCPACRHELPYLRAAYSRFQARGFEIIGMNTDEPEIVSQIKGQLEKQGMTWAEATRESIIGVIKSYRIHYFPSTLLVGPDGKIISLSQRNQPDLRGPDLLKSLDRLLPP